MYRKELLLIASFYLFMALAYFSALVIDTGAIYRHHWAVMLNHVLKAFLTLPLWFVFFRLLDEQPLWRKMVVHLLTLPLFTWIWLKSYYLLCDTLGLRYMEGSRQIWDYYITGMFYIIQFGVFHIYDYYAKLQSKDLIIAKQHQLRLKSELTALKAQLNPHFLYNVFNTINASIPASAEKTRNMIAKLSDLFRYQLKASKEEYVTVREELDFVTKYLDLEKERFGKRLCYNVEIKEDLLTSLIPPLIIQPIVENAVKHGISPLISGGTITISISKQNGQLLVTISDTGVGIDKQCQHEALDKGMGLSNTHKRLEKMFGQGLELLDNEPNGLVVRFSVRLNQEAA